MFIKNILVIDVEISLTGYLFGLLAGICAHELAHAFAGISYRAKVFEFGIGVQNLCCVHIRSWRVQIASGNSVFR